MWFVYIVRCQDKTLYTGIASDVAKRIKVHASGKGAKYTRSRLPIRLVYQEKLRTKSAALKREYAIKALSREKKIQLIRKNK